MADIRIKDLTTLASASLTGDVFVIDGTTGARKLSAFSPTFGGSVVATGGLTSSGPISTSVGISANEGTFTGGYAVFRNYGGNADTGALFLGQSSNSNFVSGTLTTIANYIGGAAICSTVAAGFRVLTTTASSSTSTGALVVGNGTSGGLGVGGAIVAGGTITSTASTDSGLLQLNLVNSSTGTSASSLFRFNAGTRTATLQAYNDTHATLAGQLRVGTSNGDISIIPSGVLAATFSSSGLTLTGAFQAGTFVKSANTAAANGSQFDALRAEIGADGTLGPLVVNVGGLPSATAASRYAYIYAGDAGTTRKLYVGGIPTGGSQVLIPATDISTSTSSGALVVSGGVGVAGKLYAGDNIQVTNSFAGNNGFNVVNTNTGGLPGLYLEGDGGEYALIRRHNSTASSPRRVEYIATGSGANHYFNTNTIIAGTITTNAPSGGTAAAWKLGTVATVSPTSPNRTIEVDIGGTIYYIHAKTTNN